MDDPATTETPEVVFAQRLLAFRLLPMRFPSQYRINLAELLNMPSILLDEVVRLAGKAWGLELLTALNDLGGHFLREARVVIVQHLQRLLMLVFGFGHNTKLAFLTMSMSHGRQPPRAHEWGGTEPSASRWLNALVR